jgi:hypothetical protein
VVAPDGDLRPQLAVDVVHDPGATSSSRCSGIRRTRPCGSLRA